MDMVLIVRVLLVMIVMVMGLFCYRIFKYIRLEKRISRYSLNDYRRKDVSLFDQMHQKYLAVASHFFKFRSLEKYARHYDKYNSLGDHVNAVMFIINKLLVGVGVVFLLVISFAIQGKRMSFVAFLFSFVIGYYLYDVYLMVRHARDQKIIRNDMLRAVIIMNNAFKAGKSILQAVEIASRELPKPIHLEFQKIYQDMAYGLSADVAFSRFASRVRLEEADYIASSLMILNKTGGNIVMVFSSIERTLFDKKKLESDLKNSTAASNLIVKVLMVIPILFVLVLCVVSPGYFDPFFESMLGNILLGIVILMFVVYIYLLNKIMKVRV